MTGPKTEPKLHKLKVLKGSKKFDLTNMIKKKHNKAMQAMPTNSFYQNALVCYVGSCVKDLKAFLPHLSRLPKFCAGVQQ